MANKGIGRARILQELKNLKKEQLEYLHAEPLQSDIYTWHFTFRGPQNTDFHEGLYHGQILLPFEYPFKPPDIIFSNKNGRFEVNTKICLTITQYHTQEWNSAWTIQTMLEAVISLFNERVMGHGYLESNSEVRRYFAKASHEYTCEKCGKISEIIKPREPISELLRMKSSEKKEQEVLMDERATKLTYKQIEEPLLQKIQKSKSRHFQKRQEREYVQEREHRRKKKEKQKKKVTKATIITPEQYFLQTLKKGNQEYVSVINSKKLFTG